MKGLLIKTAVIGIVCASFALPAYAVKKTPPKKPDHVERIQQNLAVKKTPPKKPSITEHVQPLLAVKKTPPKKPSV